MASVPLWPVDLPLHCPLYLCVGHQVVYVTEGWSQGSSRLEVSVCPVMCVYRMNEERGDDCAKAKADICSAWYECRANRLIWFVSYMSLYAVLREENAEQHPLS